MPISTTSATREQSVERYFNQTPKESDQAKAFLMMVGGFVLGAFGVIQFFLAEFLTAPLFIVTGALVFWWGKQRSNEYDTALDGTKNKPSDKWMTTLLDKDLRGVGSRAMRHLQLFPEDLVLESGSADPLAEPGERAGAQLPAKPLVVVGPDLSSRLAIGADGTWRFERYRVMVICPTGYQLAIYRGVLDFQTGNWLYEETYEYHYEDVVAVTTTRRPSKAVLEADDPRVHRKVKMGATSVLTFQISVSGNEKCSVEVGIWDDDEPGARASLRETGIDPVINAVRRVLRDRKGGSTVVL